VRYRTAAISCFSLIGIMFGLPALIWAVFLPSLREGLPNPCQPTRRCCSTLPSSAATGSGSSRFPQ
jgi:hypothetical protein